MKIKDATLREIFDSRGEPTIGVCLANPQGREFCAQVPSGKSRGKCEAAVFPPGKCTRILNKIRGVIKKKNFGSVSAFDRFLIALDGTPDKSRLGGNLMLGLSMAFARAFAERKHGELWQFLNKEFFRPEDTRRKPLIFSNLINGGLHAKNNLDFQEYLVIAETVGSYEKTVEDLIRLYENLGAFLAKRVRGGLMPIGDEGGYAVNFRDNFEPLRVLEFLISKMKLKNFHLGIDVAASSFYKSSDYRLGREKIRTDDLVALYARRFFAADNFLSIEDPFAESDIYGFKSLTEKARSLSKWVVGDDLTVTNPALIESAAESQEINAVIIKPNQIGTVTETCEAIRTAKEHKLKVIVSHRSGEVEDNFIIHLARACGADGLKIGAPARERIAKFNELLRIYG